MKSWIYASVSPTMSSHLVRLGTTANMWQKLETVFSASSGAYVMDLRLRLQTFKKGDLSIEDIC